MLKIKTVPLAAGVSDSLPLLQRTVLGFPDQPMREGCSNADVAAANPTPVRSSQPAADRMRHGLKHQLFEVILEPVVVAAPGVHAIIVRRCCYC